MLGDTVSTVTTDGVRLDGLLVTPAPGTANHLPVDIVIMHHGIGGRFYNHGIFDPMSRELAAQGCAALPVNNRGHDASYATNVQGKARMLGAAYEIVDECRFDLDAWITFAAAQGYQRIGLWGHSLGAVKTIYYLANQGDPRVVCAIASSPPRQCYANYLAQPPEEVTMFQRELAIAEQAIEDGEPERLFTTTYRRRTVFTAATYLDKYGPASRYDIFAHYPRVSIPLFTTWGALEPLPGNESHVSFHELPLQAPSLASAHPHLAFAEIPGADHYYTGVSSALWSATHAWYTGL